MAKIKLVHPMEVIDYPRFLGGEHSAASARRKRGPKPEFAWTKALMEAHADWHDIVGIPAVIKFDLEYSVRPTLHIPGAAVMSAGSATVLGLPRIDAVAYHEDGTVSLIESKMEASPSDMLQGVGQLLYYKLLMVSLEGRTVANLILASPRWPAYVIDVIDEYKLPIRLLKVSDEQINAAIPNHLQHHG